ncbi:ABC-type amino acid transport system, permease component [Lachnospiraceae bacterium JC7]|nr:ABC-type amino acid transport system, permease component [Lachnospiraceae bacterium JC7]
MRKLVQILLFTLLIICFSGNVYAQTPVTSKEQLNHPECKVGVMTGTAAMFSLEKELPEAEYVHFNSLPTAIESVKQGKLDAFVYDRMQLTYAIENGAVGVHILEENLDEGIPIAVGISPVTSIPDFTEKLNSFISETKANGVLDDMYKRWVILKEEKMPDIELPKEPKYHLVVGTTGLAPPYSYFMGETIYGYDIELAYRFAAWLGADVDFMIYDYGSIINAAVSGDVDCIMANLNVTSERKESIPFSDELYSEKIGVLVRDEEKANNNGEKSLSEFNNKRIGIQTGSVFDEIVMERLPDAKIVYLNTRADLINALETHKIDAYATDEPVLRIQMTQHDKITMFPEYLDSFEFGFVFPQTAEGQKLCDEFNEFIERSKTDGTIQKLNEKWFSEDPDKEIPDYKSLPSINGTLKVAMEGQYEPFSYIVTDGVSGFDPELITLFCIEKGYGLQFVPMNFDGILPSVQSGKCDMGCDGLTITEERKESILFSVPYFTGGTVLAVLKDDNVTGNGILDSIADSFNKTFIRESRWKMFVIGISNTLIITVLSILFGTALGFVVFYICRNGNAFANTVTKLMLWLVQGMPVVVLLMILYYIIFAKASISGIAVAVIGFTLIFSSSVFGLLKIGVGAVDNGQYEAAYALGHSYRDTFFKIILPQALPHVLPAYRGEIVGLIKATSVVGYIAVQDLTKMGDIVRSRTYEAFFPLIAITVIYFVLEWLIGLMVSHMELNYNPKQRTRQQILKGVKEND